MEPENMMGPMYKTKNSSEQNKSSEHVVIKVTLKQGNSVSRMDRQAYRSSEHAHSPPKSIDV